MNKLLNSKNLEKIVRAGVYLALLTPLVFIPQAIFGSVFGKMIYFQIVIELTFPFFLYLVFFYKAKRPKLDTLTKIILVFFGILFISAIFGENFYRSFWGTMSRMRGIFALLHCLLLYSYIITVFNQERERKKLLFFMVMVSVAVSLYGFFERINPELRIDKSGTASTSSHRVMSTTGNSIFLAGYLLFSAFLSFYYCIKYKDYTKWIASFAVVLSIVVLLYTGTRGAFVGLIAGLGVVFLLYFLLANRKQKVKIGGLFLFLFIVLMILLKFNVGFLEKSRILNISRITEISLTDIDGSISGRLLLWKLSPKPFLEHPLLGWGLENFDYAFDKHYDPAFLKNSVNETFADRAHNMFIDIAIMTGALGLLSFLFIFAFFIWRFLKKKSLDKEKVPLIGLAVAFFAYAFFAVDSPLVNIGIFILFAFVYFELNKSKSGDLESKRNNYLVFGVFVLFSLFLIFSYNIKPLQAGIAFIDFRNQDNFDLAEKKELTEIFLSDNIYLDEMQIRFGNEMFLNAAATGRMDYTTWGLNRAIEGVALGYERNQKDFSFPFLLGNLYLRRVSIFKNQTDYSKADKFFKKSLQISPLRQSLMFQIATNYLLQKKYEDAIKILTTAVALDKNIGQPHWRLGVALLAADKKEEAYKEFKKSIELGFYGTIESELNRAATLCEEFKDQECLTLLIIKIYEKRILNNNSDTEAYKNLAVLYTLIEQFDSARGAALEALRSDPSLQEEVDAFLEQIKGKHNKPVNPQ